MRHLIQYLLSALIVIGQTACFVRAVEVATGVARPMGDWEPQYSQPRPAASPFMTASSPAHGAGASKQAQRLSR